MELHKVNKVFYTHTYTHTHTHHTHANVSKVLNAPIRPRKRGMCRCILAR